MESRTRRFDGKILCIPCFEAWSRNGNPATASRAPREAFCQGNPLSVATRPLLKGREKRTGWILASISGWLAPVYKNAYSEIWDHTMRTRNGDTPWPIHRKKKQYLTLLPGRGTLRPESSLVLEVLEVPSITRIPRVPDFLVGVINLRGNAATVVDCAANSAWSPRHTKDTCVIVVEREFEGERLAVGFWPTRCARSWRFRPRTCWSLRRWTGRGRRLRQRRGPPGDGFLLVLDAERLLSWRNWPHGRTGPDR
jgi:chemotaxis signal transduction protein